MRKMVFMLIALLIFFFAYQIIINFFITNHDFDYSIKTTDNSFLIHEKYYKDNIDNYYFKIRDEDNNTFILSSNLDYNKQKQIIKNIVSYKDDNISCILPIYKKDVVGEVSCIYKGSQVDYSYLETNNVNTKKMVNKMKKNGYIFDNENKSISNIKKYTMSNSSVFSVYEDNLEDNYTFAIWNYSGLFLISKNRIEEKKYYSIDQYDNSNSVIVGKYYFIFYFGDNDTTIDINYINLEDFGRIPILLKNSLSNEMYVNGVWKNKLYVTDTKNKVQFEFSPINQEGKVISEKDKFYNLVDNKLETISKKEFFDGEKLFNNIEVKEINEKFGSVLIKQYKDFYYFLKDDTFYKVFKDDMKYPIKLFQKSGIVDWDMDKGDIIFVSGDTMYLYSESKGIKPIVSNNEFRYNYKNICNFYKKY